MRLEDVLLDSCVVVGAEFTDKASVLHDIAHRVTAALDADDAFTKRVLDALTTREAICSTGVGLGVAMPHCHLADLDDFVVGAYTVPAGVDYDAADGEPVRLIFFIVGPESKKSEHIHLLSTLAQACDEPAERDLLLGQPDSVAFRIAALEIGRGAIEAATDDQRDLVHLFVQGEEELFYQLLEVVVTLAPVRTVVVDSEESARYLTRTPLFAGLFAGERPDTSRTIVTVIDRRLTAELVRRIQKLIGPLRTSKRVMVTVSQLFYAAGSLEV